MKWIALGFGIALWLHRSPQENPDDKLPHVEIQTPERKTIYRKLRLPGEVRPNHDVGIYARVQGYVDSVPVDRGSWVEERAELAKIAVPELEKQLEKEEAELALCEPSLRKAEAERNWRKTIWERLEKIVKKTPNLVNQDILDDAKGRYEVAEADLVLTREREKSFQAAVDKTQAMVDFATIKAPFTGIITERWVDPGTLVQAGTTKMLHLMQVKKVRTRIHIPQSEVPVVREDSLTEVTVDELPERKFQGKVARIFWALNRETKTMAVEIDIANKGENRNEWVRPGMFARVTIDLEPRPDVLALPASALIVEKKKTFVFVVREGVVHKVAVEIGLDNGIEFEVKKGVEETDDVIVTGKNLVSEKERVRVTRKK